AVVPPEKFLTSSSKLPALGLYRNGVCRLMIISKAFGPPGGPVNALESDSEPLKTTVSSLPTLLAKVALKPSGVALVVERLIWILGMMDEKAPPICASGRKAIWVMRCGPETDANAEAANTC